MDLIFTNTGSAPCTLYGYPGVSLTTGTSPSTQIGAAATRTPGTGSPAVVTLQPGRTARAQLRITDALNYPPAMCRSQKTAYLQVYPPGQTVPLYLASPATGCASHAVQLLSVAAVR